jgi:hypothetical protein
MQGGGARAAPHEVQRVRERRALKHGPKECRWGRPQGRRPTITGRLGRGSLQTSNKGVSDLRCHMPYPHPLVVEM